MTDICGVGIFVWLLLFHVLVLIMKICISVMENFDQDDVITKRLLKILYFLLFPLFIGWNILGTFMLVDLNNCV
jgi:hypothetical protein